MSILQNLVAASQLDESVLRQQARSRQAQWQSWLSPISDSQPTGSDPGYDDDFQRIREEVNKISGVDTVLICQLAGQLLATTKDIRIVTYYCWARLHQDGEAGLADGLELLAATAEMADHHPETPVITMSMGALGAVSRLCGEAFGSAMTFANPGTASAPGQVGLDVVNAVLDSLRLS